MMAGSQKFPKEQKRGKMANTLPKARAASFTASKPPPGPPRYREWQEWQSLGVPIEWFPKAKAPTGLLRDERETAVNFWASDQHAEILASRPEWMVRLEGMGATPHHIEAYEKGDGEMRWYQVPLSWVKRPYPPASQRKAGKYLTWQAWEAKGVRVQHTAETFPRPEQETSFSLIDTEAKMEINTCSKAWQRRLEAEGAQPWSIDAARDGHGECRCYLVPKSWVKLPGKRGRR